MDLNVTKGLSFSDLRKVFVAKPLELGKHTVVFKEFDFAKAFLPANSQNELIPAVVQVDDETNTRIQNFTVNGTDILTKNAGRQIPAIAGRSVDEIMSALVSNGYTLDMWLVPNVKDGQTYHNWQFFKPTEAREASVTDASATDLT